MKVVRHRGYAASIALSESETRTYYKKHTGERLKNLTSKIKSLAAQESSKPGFPFTFINVIDSNGYLVGRIFK